MKHLLVCLVVLTVFNTDPANASVKDKITYEYKTKKKSKKQWKQHQTVKQKPLTCFEMYDQIVEVYNDQLKLCENNKKKNMSDENNARCYVTVNQNAYNLLTALDYNCLADIRKRREEEGK